MIYEPDATTGTNDTYTITWSCADKVSTTYTIDVVTNIPADPVCIITSSSSGGLMHKGQSWTFSFIDSLTFSSVDYNQSGPQSISVTWYPQGQDTNVTTTQEYSLDVSASGSTIEVQIEMTNDGGHSGGNLLGTAQGVLDAVNKSCESGDDGCTCVTLSIKDQTINGKAYKGTTSFGACLGYVKPNTSSGTTWQNAYLKFYAFGTKVGNAYIPKDLPECT